MFFWSGERRDAAALVDEPRPPKAAQTVDPPERTQAATFDSPERLPGLELPRQAPSPSDMLDHLEVVDELGARGAAYAGVVATGPSGSTSAEVDGLTGIMGRQHCEMNPATGRYSYHDQGLAFQQGAASAVYTLRVEAIQRQGQAISSLEAPPGAGDDGSGLGGAAWTGLAVATGALGWVGTRGLSSLYSRLGREDLLEDETRRLIHEHVHERPGVSLADIASGHDKHRSTLAYHLERLEEMGFVETRTTPSGLVAFPPKSPLVDDAETLAKGQAIELVETVIDDPGAHLTAYADELGVAKSYVSRLARELEEAGFLDRTREGRRLLLEPGPRARQLSPETDG